MTTTAETPTVAPQPPVADPTIPALLHDAGGYFRVVDGRRIPTNEPGIAVLDGTPAEAAYQTAATLNAAMTALKRQYEDAIAIVQKEIGEKKVAMLNGQKVVTWRWSTRKSLDATLAEAILTDEQYRIVKQETPYRAFEPKFRG